MAGKKQEKQRRKSKQNREVAKCVGKQIYYGRCLLENVAKRWVVLYPVDLSDDSSNRFHEVHRLELRIFSSICQVTN